MSILSRTCFGALIAALSLTGLACDDGAVDRIDNRLDCRAICQEYHDCIDDDTELDDCRDSCADKALDDNEWEEKVDQCGDCVTGDNSCAERTFQCADECIGIVP